MQATKLMTAAVLALCAPLAACDRPVSFANDVQPILDASCVRCHGGSGEGAEQSGVDLTGYDGVMKGTKFGPIVVAGSSESSVLFQVVAHETAPEIHMPPHTEDALAEGRGFALSDSQIQTIGEWIDEGAENN
jgi:predicted small secreted protein